MKKILLVTLLIIFVFSCGDSEAKIIEPILTNATGLGSPNDIANEIQNLEKYHYEFFSINAGSADYKTAGRSLKNGSGTPQRTPRDPHPRH